MTITMSTLREAPAYALAMLVAANGRLDERALLVLERMQAFDRLGVDRERFIEIAHTCAHDVGTHLCENSWLCESHLIYINALLDGVTDEEVRRLVCGLGWAAITADGQFTDDERLVFEHALAHWHISQDTVANIPPN